MQYVGRTGRSLKTRFPEHLSKMKKPKKFDTFLYPHFKSYGHSRSNIVIQPVEKRKNGNIKLKICTEKHLNTSLKDLSIALNNHGRHGLFSFLRSLPISVLRNLELEAINLTIEQTNYIK